MSTKRCISSAEVPLLLSTVYPGTAIRLGSLVFGSTLVLLVLPSASVYLLLAVVNFHGYGQNLIKLDRDRIVRSAGTAMGEKFKTMTVMTQADVLPWEKNARL